MKKERRSIPLVGASSLIVIFAVVCLAVFAMLSVNTAMADERLSQKTAEIVSEYYAAEKEANEILSELRQGNIPDGVTQDGDVFSYSCEISENQELCVNVTVNEKGGYRIDRWQVNWTGDWSPNDDIDVWDGN